VPARTDLKPIEITQRRPSFSVDGYQIWADWTFRFGFDIRGHPASDLDRRAAVVYRASIAAWCRTPIRHRCGTGRTTRQAISVRRYTNSLGWVATAS
jgi:hypothetical protein